MQLDGWWKSSGNYEMRVLYSADSGPGRGAAVQRRVILNESFLFEKIQGITMPKLKTHKGASKRFKKTGTGKVVRNHAFGRHILTSKPHKRKKKLHKSVVADAANQPALKRMLPY